jgi:sorting nexin-29
MAMRDLDIPVKLIRMVEVTMTDVKSSIRVGGYLSEPITVRNGLRQGDTLACLLFNIALEKVIREAGIQTRGTIFYKSVQILAYADDVDIVGRSLCAMEEAMVIESTGRKMGLVINETKTKYMVAGKAYRPNMPPNLIIANYTFARVNTFVYLGSTVSYNNDISEEIGARLVAANRAYFGLLGHFKSRLLSRQTKLIIYKTLVRPVLTYASETWAIAKAEERLLELFERKILCRIVGPICENGEWRK